MNDKQPEKIFCLYHQKVDCACITSQIVTTQQALIERLKSVIANNELPIKYISEGKEKRIAETAECERRLRELGVE